MTMQDDDLDAIDVYMKATPIYTAEATRLRDDWITWWDDLGWYAKSFDADVFDVARNKKNAFNLANARTPPEKAQIRESLKTAFTTEEARGEPRRMLSDGTYTGQEESESESEPFFPLRVKIAGGVAAAVLAALFVVKKIYVDPFVRR